LEEILLLLLLLFPTKLVLVCLSSVEGKVVVGADVCGKLNWVDDGPPQINWFWGGDFWNYF